MSEMIAYCGLPCSDCPIYLATKADDDAMRAETAQIWSKRFNLDLKPEDINCLGCPSDQAPLFGYCQACGIRKCAREKNLDHCAQCDDYSCEALNQFHALAPRAKEQLEKLRA